VFRGEGIGLAKDISAEGVEATKGEAGEEGRTSPLTVRLEGLEFKEFDYAFSITMPSRDISDQSYITVIR